MSWIRTLAFLAVILTGRQAFAIGCTDDPSICQSPLGPCDKGSACINNFCVNQGREPAGTVCGPPTDLCDVPEVCDGTSVNCPASTGAVKPAGTACRSAAPGALCDLPDTCNGSSATCPDSFVAAGTVCRGPADNCDIPETCTGASKDCPATDARRPNGFECRGAAGPCDVAETCVSGVCPPQAFRPNTFECQPAAGDCALPDLCSGSSATCPALNRRQPSTHECRPAVAGGCDLAETCDGTSVSCPANQVQPDDHPCSDGNACTVGDACRAGVCVIGGPPLTASMVDFGPALVLGTPRTAMLMLEWRDPASSAGVTALTSSNAEFRVAAGQAFPIALSPAAASASVMMEFQPTEIGPRTGTLTATLDPATCAIPMIDLVGTGSPPGLIANPGNNDFAQVDVGATSPPKIFQIVNLSGGEATIQSVVVSDPANFSLTADGLPAVTPADGTYSFTISARPQTAGVHDADVVVTSTSALNPTLTVHVEGVCPGGSCDGVDAGPGGGGGHETPGPVSPLACAASAGAPGVGWTLVGLAFLVVRRRVRRR
jgi:hypothetical protein